MEKPQVFKFSLLIFAVFVFFSGCGAIDSIIPSAGTYRVNVRINARLLDDFSFVSAGDKVTPFFVESVSGDVDVTGLMVFLISPNGDIAGFRVLYSLDENADENQTVQEMPDNEQENQESQENQDNEDLDEDSDSESEDAEELIVPVSPANIAQHIDGEKVFFHVRSLDRNLPAFPIPPTLPIGRYIMVSQVMSGDRILQRIEKPIFFLADAEFSFNSIQVNLSGIAENKQLIPRGSVIMLEARLDYDERLDPYIIWFSGREIIGEGLVSEGAASLLWRVPDQSGFFSLRPEVFPMENRRGLAGFQREISLLVASRDINLNLLSEDFPGLLHHYTFEGNLSNSINNSREYDLTSISVNSVKWMAANGTYGLASGFNNAYKLPGIYSAGNEAAAAGYRIIFRFLPVQKGEILSLRFPAAPSDVVLRLERRTYNYEERFILSLACQTETVYETLVLPELDSFITAVIDYSLEPERVSANFGIIKNINFLNTDVLFTQGVHTNILSLASEFSGESQIVLGSRPVESGFCTGNEITAIWDELAVVQLITDDLIFTVIDDEGREETIN